MYITNLEYSNSNYIVINFNFNTDFNSYFIRYLAY